MKIKVCGITRAEDLNELVNNQVDYAGFIFHEKSPRFVGNKLDARTVRETTGINKVGVFVNVTIPQIQRTIADYKLDLVQLHGDETPEYCALLKETVPVVKAFRIGANVDWEKEVGPYVAVTDYFLFDTASVHLYGGTGESFNWDLLATYPYTHPFFLSGGIGPDDAAVIEKLVLPALYAVDVNSKFETGPGVKDLQKVQQFVKQIHSSYSK
jgi:phosphoribosylanthranilate isomerase